MAGQNPVGKCRKCQKTWFSPSQAHCSVCCRHFGSAGYFDKHRRYGKCVDPETLSGIELRDGIWRGPELDPGADVSWRERRDDKAK